MDTLSGKFIEWVERLNNKLKYTVIFGAVAFWISGSFLSFFEQVNLNEGYAMTAFLFICYGILFSIPFQYWNKDTKNKEENTILIIKATGAFAIIFPVYVLLALEKSISPEVLLLIIFFPALLFTIHLLAYQFTLKMLSSVFHNWFKYIIL